MRCRLEIWTIVQKWMIMNENVKKVKKRERDKYEKVSTNLSFTCICATVHTLLIAENMTLKTYLKLIEIKFKKIQSYLLLYIEYSSKFTIKSGQVLLYQ